MRYKYATVVRQTTHDPRNNIEAGRVEIVAGKFANGVIRTVVDEEKGDFVDIRGVALETFEADHRMPEGEIKSWGAERAQESDTDYAKEKRDCPDCGGVQIVTEEATWGCTDPNCAREDTAEIGGESDG